MTGQDFAWYAELQMSEWRSPPDAMRLERREWGDFYGYPLRVLQEGEVVAEGEGLWEALQARVERANRLFRELRRIERNDVGVISAEMEELRLRERALQRDPDIDPRRVRSSWRLSRRVRPACRRRSRRCVVRSMCCAASSIATP